MIEIRNYQQTYHRNGIGGTGGFWATFEALDPDQTEWDPETETRSPGTWHRYMGWLWSEHRGQDDVDTPNECSVVRLGDIVGMSAGKDPERVMAWRSTDYFLPALMPHYRQARDAWYASVKAQWDEVKA